MLSCDAKQFNLAAQAMLQAAVACRDPSGLLVQPPNLDFDRYRAAVRGALALIFNAPIKCSDEEFLTTKALLKATIDE